MMPFATDDLGRPIFFISTMAMHTQSLHQDARASLLITQPGAVEDPLGAARLTLIGAAKVAPAEEVRELYLSRYENARYWQDYTDFAYYRLEVEGVYFIGGFGVMGWIQAEEVFRGGARPAGRSGAGDHPAHECGDAGALRRIAGHDTGEVPDEASISAIDRLGFHLRLRTGERVHGRRIAFPREVTDRSAARAVFIEMVRACS